MQTDNFWVGPCQESTRTTPPGLEHRVFHGLLVLGFRALGVGFLFQVRARLKNL